MHSGRSRLTANAVDHWLGEHVERSIVMAERMISEVQLLNGIEPLGRMRTIDRSLKRMAAQQGYRF